MKFESQPRPPEKLRAVVEYDFPMEGDHHR
jgi:hypothetical protein